MKKTLLLSLLSILSISVFAQLNVTYVSDVKYNQDLSDVWGYVAPDGTEYAIVGVNNGVSIVNLADPENPVESDFITGPSSIWRDIKTWGQFAYVTNETGGGLLVIDLTTLPGEVNSFNWAPNISGVGTLSNAHNIWIDEFGFAYLCGSNLNGGGLIYVDVATTPGTPVYAGKGAPVYSHDVYVRNNLSYSSEINVGRFAVYNVADKSNTVLLGSQETPASASHNAWLSDDSNFLFTTDETGNAPVTAYDVSDPTNIKELDQFRPLETLGDGVIPHNVHVWNDWIIISYYTDGCIIVDAKYPDNLIEVGNFDTYIPTGTGFDGAWGAYPFLPSGLILVSDIGDGLYVLAPNYVRACYLEGKITDAQTGSSINGATIDILGDLAFENSNLAGNYKTGLATAGTYTVEVKKTGYATGTATVELENDVITILNMALQPLPSFAMNGVVKDAATNQVVANSRVQIINDDFEFNVTTNASGQFNVSTFYEGNYDVLVGKWGYKTAFLSSQDFDQNNNSIEILINKGIEDVFSLDLGWTVEGDAPQGIFERGNPIGVNPPQVGYYIQPEDDDVNDPGNSCYFTGNTADLFGGVQTTGTTRLVSPVFDLTGMNQPHISYSTWIFTVNITGQPVPGNDKLIVKLSNGTQTVVVQQLSFATLFVAPVWVNSVINVADTITPTSNMRIIFEIGDNDPNVTDVAEVGVDYFRAFDDISPANEAQPEGISMTVFPNPTAGEFFVEFKMEDFSGSADLRVYNQISQLVETQSLQTGEGKVALGQGLEKGFYFVRIQQDGQIGRAVKVVKL